MPEAKLKTAAQLVDAVAAAASISERFAVSVARAQIWKLVWTCYGPVLIADGIRDGLQPGLLHTIFGALFVLAGAGSIVFGFHFWKLETSLKKSRAHWTAVRDGLVAQLGAAVKD